MDGWAKIKLAARYAGVSERTFRGWLSQGLRHSRLPTGTILIRFSAIDGWLESFSVEEHPGQALDAMVDGIVKEVSCQKEN